LVEHGQGYGVEQGSNCKGALGQGLQMAQVTAVNQPKASGIGGKS